LEKGRLPLASILSRVKKDAPDLEFILAEGQETSAVVLVIRGLLILGAGTLLVAAVIQRVF
jgi:hypothetical protein